MLLPILTNGAKLYSQRLASFHFWAHLLGGIGMGAFMGMAGLKGMLRRTIYYDGEFLPYMILAALSGALLLLAFAAFLLNIVMTVGLKGALGIFQRSAWIPGSSCRRPPSSRRLPLLARPAGGGGAAAGPLPSAGAAVPARRALRPAPAAPAGRTPSPPPASSGDALPPRSGPEAAPDPGGGVAEPPASGGSRRRAGRARRASWAYLT